MARKIKFALEMPDGVKVRGSLEELREHFDLEAVAGYFLSGKLTEWLNDRYYEDETEKLGEIDKDAPDFHQKLCEVLGVEYVANDDLDVAALERLNEKKAILRQKTDEEEIIKNADKTALTQEDLADLLDIGEKTIYLCGYFFNIPLRIPDIKYVGILGKPTVSIKANSQKELDERNIKFENVMFDGKCEEFNQDIAESLFKKGKESEDKEQYTEAFEWYKKAAEQGYPSAQASLGKCYYWGNGVEQNYDEAVKWLRRAAEQGDALAENRLGNCYYYGDGVEQDYEEAVKWYLKSANHGCAFAEKHLGDCYYYGAGVEQDYEEAAKWYLKSANQGNTDAQFSLGYLYDMGEGVMQSCEKAVVWYRKAADAGNPSAQNNLAVCYMQGYGVEKDLEEAIKWYRMAAEGENSDALNALGDCYYDGRGVKQDYEESVKYYRKAAELGNRRAYSALWRAYSYGHGVGKDIEKAKKWMSKLQKK